LREVCAKDALEDPDPATRALMLGFDSVGEYATWIRNEFHWGGENEVLVLARHYRLEVAVVCCQSLRVLYYGAEIPGCTGRVMLLYTGQHYDPLVFGPGPEVSVAEQQAKLASGDASREATALQVAVAHNEEAARRASQRRAKKIKCGGCGAILDDNEAFAAHCGEVEHDDDFAYDCEMVEVVIEAGDGLPEGSVDLTSDAVHTFNNTEREPLAHQHPTPVNVGGVLYPTLEHYWLAAPFLGQGSRGIAEQIARTPTVDEATIIANGAEPNTQREDWREKRSELLMEGLRAKAAQSDVFKAALVGTGEKMIVLVSTDPWAGMQAPGGIATGQNNVGKCLVALREELRK